MNLNSVKISIIVPIYNVEKYLQRCINSLRNQTLKDIEIILVNDGSSDNSGMICEQNAKRDNRIKVIHKQNSGVSDARNSGIEQAIGEYLLFVDPDDWCETTFVVDLYNSVIKYFADISICGYSIDYLNNNYSIHKGLTQQKIFYKSDIAEAIYFLEELGMFNVVWNKIYRKKIITQNNIFFDKEFSTGEDFLFNCEYFKHINSVAFVDSILYHYLKQDEVTLVTKYRPDLYEKIKKINNVRMNFYNHYNMNTKKYIECYANRFTENIMACISNNFKNNNLSYKQKSKFINLLMLDEQTKRWINLSTGTMFYEKLLKILFKINSSIFTYFLFVFLYNFRNRFDSKYKKIRKLILK